MNNEKFCLRWNDFESNISQAFRELRDDKDFFDVTLACDDEQIQAHKVILSACSSFFRNILRRNPHQHPLLYVKGVKFTDMQAVLNFMYHGEVNVAQEELNSFLEVAEDLKVKGLTQTQSSHQAPFKEPFTQKKHKPTPSVPKSVPRGTEADHILENTRPPHPPPAAQDDDIQEVVPIKSEPLSSLPLASPHIQPQVYSSASQPASQAVTTYQEETGYEDYGDYQDQGYTETDISMEQTTAMQGTDHSTGSSTQMFQDYVSKSEQSSAWQCTICGKESAQKVNLVKHVENVHFPDSFSYDCKYCNQSFNTKNKLYVHIARTHKNN